MKLDDDFYDNFIEEILEFADTYGIERPSNRKKGRKRVRTETDSTEIDALESYKNLFKEVIDVFIYHLSEKFHSDSYKPLIAISTLLTANEKPDLGNIFFDLAIYRLEYDIDELEKELSIWYDYKTQKNLKTIKEIHQAFSKKDLKIVFPNLFILLSIFLTVPVSSASCERSFSCLKRLKTWLRSTVGQERLSSLAISHINSTELLNLDSNKLVEIFASKKERRMDLY